MVGRGPAPPRAPRRPVELHAFGDVRVDPWYWLRDRDDPAVLAYLRAENEYCEAATAPTAARRDRLYEEIRGRVQETDVSAPVRRGRWEYLSRTLEGAQYAQHLRRPAGSPGGSGDVVLLDENELASGCPYFSLGGFAPSPSKSLLAYAVDLDGGERHTLRIRDLDPGVELPDVVEDVYYGLAWSDGDRSVFYVRPDPTMRPWQVWCHALGTPTAHDRLVFEEPDERFFVSVIRARSDRLVVISTASKTTSEVRLVPSSDPGAPPVVVRAREEGVEYHVEHHVAPDGSERLFVLSNRDGAVDFALHVASVDGPGCWTPLVPHRPGVRLEDVDAFVRHLVLSERSEGLGRLRVVPLGTDGRADLDGAWTLAPPDPVASVWVGPNPEATTSILRHGTTSLVLPVSDYDTDLDRGQTTLVKRQPVLGGYDPDRFVSARLWATAPDGERVPISVVHRRDVARDGSAPLVLYGYGAYEHSSDPTFSSSRVSLLERGVVFAIAHVRGGGELGRRWYEAGRLRHKQASFTDFIACAEHLVTLEYASPRRLAARGGSAGGLLVAATTMMRPDLFRAVVAEVPFVDVVTTMRDPSIPLTVTEWEEWGNPLESRDDYETLKSYSPYDNVRATEYPAMLVTAGLHDPRVAYWEPAKWVARLRATRTDDRLLLLKTELEAGHQGPSGRYDAWRDEAFVLAFLLEQLDVPW